MTVQTFRFGPYVATAKAVPSGKGFTSEWWITEALSNPDSITVIGALDVPVYGNTENHARQRISFIAQEVIEFTRLHSGGSAVPQRVPSTMDHIHAQLDGHQDFFDEMDDDLGRVAVAYNLLSEFRVKNPAEVIGKHFAIHSVRTVHDRVRRAREDDLIPRLGRGRSHA